MRLAVVADLHITERPCRSDVPLEEQARILREIAREIHDQDADAVLIAGDLYDGKSTSAERRAVWSFLKSLEPPVVAIRGNHDDPLDIEAMLHLVHVHAFTIPGVANVCDLDIACAPWPTVKVENGAALYADVVRGLLAEKPDVLLAHCDLVGAQLDGGQETTGKVSSVLTAADFTVPTFLGHYHRRQQVGECAWYVGGIRQMRFGDDAAKGFGIYDTDAKEWEWFGPYGRQLVCVEGEWDATTNRLRLLESLPVGVEGCDQSSPTGRSFVRFRYRVDEPARGVARGAAEVVAKEAGWTDYVIEPKVIADTRTRGAEVAEAKGEREKLEAYWGDERPARADEILRKMEGLG